MKASSKVYFPNLDGLRFLCFLSVFFFHSFATGYDEVMSSKLYGLTKLFLFRNGNLGVNFFFVLSGFLITFLLLTEKKRYGKVNIPNFYIRRILRIWPLFYFCVIFGFYIFPQVKLLFGQIPNETAHIGYYLVFLNNFDFVKNGLPDSSVLSILWSVAIEEQFYLIWPFIISFLPPRYIMLSFSLLVIGTFVFRYVHSNQPIVLEHHTFSCISDMAVGGFFAFLCFTKKSFLEKVVATPKTVWLLFYLGIIVIFFFRRQIFSGSAFMLAFDRFFISILFAFVIIEQNYAQNSIFKMSRFKVISKLGIYTYGLYCLHMIGILIAAKGLAYLGLNKNVYQVIFLEGGLSLAITLVLAFLSYHFFESRFLLLKDRFALVKTQHAPNPSYPEPTGRRRPGAQRHVPDQIPRSGV